MTSNPNITNLDWNQAVSRCVDADNDALRVEIGGDSEFAVALSSDEGDSVMADSNTASSSANLTSTNTGIGTEVLAPQAATKFSRANIYVQATSITAGSVTLKLQLSPAASGNIWIDSGVSVVVPTTSGAVAMGTATANMVAMRARLVSSAALGALETCTAYLVMGS